MIVYIIRGSYGGLMRRLVPVPARIGSAALGALPLATPPPVAAGRRSGVGSSASDASPSTSPTHARTAPPASPGAFSCRAKMRTCENALPPSSPIPAARLRAAFANAKVGKCEKGDGAPGWAYRRWGGRLRFPPRNEKTRPIGGYRGGRVYNLWQARRCYQHLRD